MFRYLGLTILIGCQGTPREQSPCLSTSLLHSAVGVPGPRGGCGLELSGQRDRHSLVADRVANRDSPPTTGRRAPDERADSFHRHRTAVALGATTEQPRLPNAFVEVNGQQIPCWVGDGEIHVLTQGLDRATIWALYRAQAAPDAHPLRIGVLK